MTGQKKARSWFSLQIPPRGRQEVLPAALILAAALAFATLFPSAGFAGQVMPDFADIPTGWYVDRYNPHSFSNVGTFQGRDNVLGIEITSAEGTNSRPSGYSSSFYNTQGRGHDLTGGSGSVLSAALYIPAGWGNAANGNFRTDLWGVMTDGKSVTGYPTIGFTNYGGSPRYRIWDEVNGFWINLPTAVTYNAWTSIAIAFTGSSYIYSINGIPVLTDTNIDPSTTAFKEVIMQAYNFYDPSLTGANPVDYTAYWSNTPAHSPIPGSLVLLGTGLFALGLLSRRKFFR